MPFRNIFKHFSRKPKQEESSQSESQEQPKMFADLGMEKLKAVIDEVTSSFAIFEKAGFEVEEVQVEIGVAPKLIPRFKHLRDIPIADQEALIEEAGDRKLVKFMLISLFKSSKMQKLIKDPKLEFHAIEIDLTAVPSVRGIFKAIRNSEKVIRIGSHDHH